MLSSPVADDVPLVQLRGISRSFPGVRALDNVNLELQAGTIHALLGENGAGKSTLINILSGVLAPEAGEFLLRGKVVAPTDAHAARALGIAAVHQEADLFPDLTVAENVALEHGWPTRNRLIDWPRLRQLTRAAIRELGCALEPDQSAAWLTAAERQLVAIAAALAQAGQVLILDEPTSSLSAGEAATLFTHLRRFRDAGGAVLYVSHRLEEVFELADLATVLRDGKRVWSGALTGITPEQLVSWMVGRERDRTCVRRVLNRADAKAAEPPILACQALTAVDRAFAEITLELRRGEILGLYGLIGAGRSEWAEALFGMRSIAEGQVRLHGKPWQPRNPGQASRAGFVYLPEDRLRSGLFSTLSVRANTVISALRRFSWGPFVSQAEETREAQRRVQALGVRLRSLAQPARTLSGGNQQKVLLVRWLACDPQILILDEPTRGVDVGAKAEIHALLRRLADSGRAIILISSDLPEILAHSDRIGVFCRGRLVADFDAATASAEQVGAAALAPTRPADPVASEQRARLSRTATRKETIFREAGLWAAVLVLVLALGLTRSTFLEASTLRDVAANACLLVLAGLASALVIFTGGIDISFGSMMALSAAVAGSLMQHGVLPVLAVTGGLAAGAAAGGLNAALTLLGRVHPIVITLGTLSVYRGLAFVVLGGREIYNLPDRFRTPLLAAPLGIPTSAWLAVVILLVAWWLLGWTVAGRQALALGSNPRAAERSGIHRGRVWLAVFSLQGLLAGVTGVLALGLAGNLQPTDYEEYTLEAISVAVVGGVAISGGRGSVWGVWAAAFLFRVLEKGWVMLHISSYWQRTIVGSLLLLAILGDRLWRRRASMPEPAHR
jgi:ABC-type sugar transport system ATPase subunit/ribose/xylose/arabinose/galactoside ABC-type transport system permease subunit